MARLAQKEVPGQKADRIEPQKKMQQRVENPAGFRGGKSIRGLERDQSEPKQGRQPRLPDRRTR